MKTTTSLLLTTIACLFATGCTGLDMNSGANQLSFSEPDPFLMEGAAGDGHGGRYPSEPLVSQPVGRARVGDAVNPAMNQIAQAIYTHSAYGQPTDPQVVDVAMPLIPNGTEYGKPTGSSLQVPQDLMMASDINQPASMVVSTGRTDDVEFEDIEFEADPFAGGQSDSESFEPEMVAATNFTPVDFPEFAGPARSTALGKTVAVSAEESFVDQSTASSTGWRATR